MSATDLPLPVMRSGIELVPTRAEGDPPETGKDYTSDQEVRWCPGCGDYAVLKAVQGFLPDLGLRQRGLSIAQAHLRNLNPMPRNLESVLKSYARVVIPEMNLGQLAHLIRGRYLIDAVPFNQVSGLPFTAATLENMLEDVVKNG